jgi:hypothetical protein
VRIQFPGFNLAFGLLALAIPHLPAIAQGNQLPVDGDRIPTGNWIYEFHVAGRYSGDHTSVIHRQEGLIVSTSFYFPGRYNRQEGSVTVRAEDLSPVGSYVLLENPGESEGFEARMNYTVDGDSLRIQRTIVRQAFPAPYRLPPVSRWAVPTAGHFDNQQIDLLVQALPLEPGRSWSVRLLDPTVDHTISVTIRVVESRETATPAGTFEVWHVTIRGLAIDVAYDVEKESHMLVAQYLPAQDIQLLLKRRP